MPDHIEQVFAVTTPLTTPSSLYFKFVSQSKGGLKDIAISDKTVNATIVEDNCNNIKFCCTMKYILYSLRIQSVRIAINLAKWGPPRPVKIATTTPLPSNDSDSIDQ